MKVNITYKFPDAIDYAVQDAVRDFEGDKFELDEKKEEIRERLLEILGDSEYVNIEVDLEAGTAIVKPPRKW